MRAILQQAGQEMQYSSLSFARLRRHTFTWTRIMCVRGKIQECNLRDLTVLFWRGGAYCILEAYHAPASWTGTLAITLFASALTPT